jgi:nucleotide-binding universal stress UspA family protein
MEQSMIPIKRILVPTDFSEPAASALKWATTLAKEFEARKICVIPDSRSSKIELSMH